MSDDNADRDPRDEETRDDSNADPTEEAGPDDDEAARARREQVQKAVNRARGGARKLSSWLGERLGSAVQSARNSDIVRRKLGEFTAHREEREQARRVAALQGIYDAWLADIVEAIRGIQEHTEALGVAIEEVDRNISDLRIRGIDEQDEEMREYRGHITEMRNEVNRLHEQLGPFRDEMERIDRHRRAALARLQSEVEDLDDLQAEARQHVAESKHRLGSLLSLIEGSERPDPGSGSGAEAGSD